jgi:L,D-peptidoglycan transpeptidase YkuD (ErfK/YbiS/YcfS/YnhG family)
MDPCITTLENRPRPTETSTRASGSCYPVRARTPTQGCIAVTNDEIEEIRRVVPTGTPVEIRP